MLAQERMMNDMLAKTLEGTKVDLTLTMEELRAKNETAKCKYIYTLNIDVYAMYTLLCWN